MHAQCDSYRVFTIFHLIIPEIMYDSNTVQCLRKDSQCFLFATQGNIVCSEIHKSTDKIYFPYLTTFYLCSSNYRD
jgi:hypothetical protein